MFSLIFFLHQITEPIVDGRIQNKIERNREKHQLIVDRQLSTPPADAVLVFVRIQHYVRYILAQYGQLQQLHVGQLSAPSAANQADLYAISAVGIAFFYEIVNGMSEFADAFPPAHELLGDVLAQLGCLIRDNQSSEGVRLLQTALRRPHLVQLLAEMFTPSATAPVYFLEMYRFVVDSHMQKCDTKILFVLLSKVSEWWRNERAGLSEPISWAAFIGRYFICSLMWPSGWVYICRNSSTSVSC